MSSDTLEKSVRAQQSAGPKNPLSFEALRDWIALHLAKRAGVEPAAVQLAERFQRLGLDSMGATAMLIELGLMLRRPLSPTLAWEFPTPEGLARHLANGDISASVRPPAPTARSRDDEPIAIIGMACRFPQASSPEEFWTLLRGGVDAITEVPRERWDIDAWYDPDPAAPGKMNTKWGGFLSSVDTFDPGFFGISPREAVQIDPQQRLALELSWEALEDARLAPASLRDSRTGVFFGAMWMDYLRLLAGASAAISLHTATGQDLSIVPARVSYSLGLSGPSIVVNTACSSSLVAVHLACQSLLRGETQLALAGGINLMLSPESTVAMSKFGAMASDGRSKAFDSRANGYVRGEGGGVVVLKRLSAAQADGDRIHCVIRGSAVNNDGFSNGLTAPSPHAQEAVLRDACAAASVDPTEIGYVEAHGTGTMLGDPIEAGALGAVLGAGAGRSAERPLRIGSVKTNIGHLEAAAGVAGLIKVALSMQHGALPKSLHFERPNPHIPFAVLGLKVQTNLAPWNKEKGRLLAGVSSFGFGGTNCHVVVEECPTQEPYLFLLSASSEQALQLAARQQAEGLSAADGPSLAALCAKAAQEKWEEFRLAAVVRSRGELLHKLHAFADGKALPGLMTGRCESIPPRVALLFTGQGAQYVGMGQRLYQTQPIFRAAVDRCAERLADKLARPLLAVMWAGQGTDDAALLHRTAYTQPALFTIEYALADMWRSFGIQPEFVIGHSVGELAAACVSGVLSLDDALELVVARGRLMDGLPPGGAMFAIATSEAEAAPRLSPWRDRVGLAAVNGPTDIVISGDASLVASIAESFATEGIKVQQLRVSHAFHSPLMAPMKQEFQGVASSLSYELPRIPLVTCLDGKLADAGIAGPEHWVQHIQAPVRFADALKTLARNQATVLIEVGPQPVLVELAAKLPDFQGAARVASMARTEEDTDVLCEALGQLFVAGVPVRLRAEGSGSSEEPASKLFALSARSQASLQAQAERLREHLEAHPEVALKDVAYSLAFTRTAMDHRVALIANSPQDLRAKLDGVRRGERPPGTAQGTVSGTRGKLAFLFTGQGAQVPGMGQGLYAAWPAFRQAFDRCTTLFDRELARPLREVMWGQAGSEEAALLDQTGYTQPALFALEYALYQLWQSWGAKPELVAGHSIGELVAACVVGVFTLEEGVRLCAARGRLMQALPAGGAMVSISASEAEVAAAVGIKAKAVSIAAVNGPEQVVIAGERSAVAEIAALYAARGIPTKELQVSHAFHSPLMEPMLGAFREVAKTVEYQSPRAVLVSTVTGKECTDEVRTAEYWVRHVREAVRFADGVQALREAGARTFVEIGPKATLLSVGPRCLPSVELALVPSMRAGRREAESVMEALGALWASGSAVDWEGVFPSGGRRVSLPTYAWQRQRYWVETSGSAAVGAPARLTSGGHPLLGQRLTLSTQTNTQVWETTLDLKRLSWLKDHRVQDAATFPGAGYAEMALAAGGEVFGTSSFAIKELSIIEALSVEDEGAVPLQVVTTEEQPGVLRFQVASKVAAPDRVRFRVHARGLLSREEVAAPAALELPALFARLKEHAVADEYAALSETGLLYGPAFQGIEAVWRGDEEALGRVSLTQAAGSIAGYKLHPALLDACLQVTVGAVAVPGYTTPWLPVKIEVMRLFQPPARELYCYVKFAPPDAETLNRRRADLWLVNRTGVVVAELRGLVVQRLVGGAQRREQDDWFLGVEWESLGVPAPKVKAGRWLLLGDGGGLGKALRSALEKAGQAVVHADELPSKAEAAVLPRCFGAQGPTAVVHLGSAGRDAEPEALDLEAVVEQGASVLRTVQALSQHGYRDAPQLWMVTRGAQAIGEGSVRVSQAPLLGLGRTIAMEHAELRCARVDLDPERPAGEVEGLVSELLGDEAEDEVALRGGARWGARLVHQVPDEGPAEKQEAAQGRAFRLEIDKPGVLDHLVLRAISRRAPGPGEVEIAVEAAGLNFLDVMKAMGIYPGLGDGPVALGSECAGYIAAVGDGVTNLQVGQRVLALTSFCFATHVTVSAQLAVQLAASLNTVQAAGFPLVFMTAWYGLVHLARLRAGERVLIHSATGGTGLAAVQIARHLGAEVFATAGTPEKRAWLHRHGIAQVMDSRTLDFAAQVLAATQGEGVDVVLNSLSGEAIDASLSCLTADGRFIELGKTDIYKDRPLGLAPFKKSLSFSAVDLAALAIRRQARFVTLLNEVMGLLNQGVLQPLAVESLPISQAADAFRKMAQAQHIGKLVLKLPDPSARIQVRSESAVPVRSDGSYLITGGLGGLGLSAAAWLAKKGAGHVVLMGRSGANGADQQVAVATLSGTGCRVTVAKADVADRAQLSKVLNGIEDSGMPLRGVIHAAGVLDDGVLVQQRAARLRKVMEPKVQGAWNLHELTKYQQLDMFVMYGSVSGLLGAPGQGNYAAANTFLDALAYHRRRMGLAGLSIDWGAFSEVGMAAAKDNRGARLAARGMRSLSPKEGLAALERVMNGRVSQIGVVPLNLRQWGAFNQAAAASRRLSRLRAAQSTGASRPTGDRDLLSRLAAADPATRITLLQDVLRAQSSQVLQIPESRLNWEAPLTSLGLDSLMALELRNRIESIMGIQVPASLLWTYPTVAALSGHLAHGAFAPTVEVSEVTTDSPAADNGIADDDVADGDAAEDYEKIILTRFEALK